MDSPILQVIKSKLVALQSYQQLTYLNLSDIQCEVFPAQGKVLLQKCPNLYHLNMTNCRLRSLQNMPNLSLTVLLLGCNNITDDQLHKLSIYCNSLEQLDLKKNNIKKLECINVFKPFTALQELNLKQNQVCAMEQPYHKRIFKEILNENPNLKFVDHFKRNGEIVSDDEFKDEDLNGPQWIMPEEEENEDQSCNDIIEQMDEEQVKAKKSLMLLDYLNENQTFKDPKQNCFDEVYQIDNYAEGQQFEEEQDLQVDIAAQNFKYKTSKKRKSTDQQTPY